MSLKTQVPNLTLESYKQYTTQEFLPWDEKFDSVILTYQRNYYFNPQY